MRSIVSRLRSIAFSVKFVLHRSIVVSSIITSFACRYGFLRFLMENVTPESAHVPISELVQTLTSTPDHCRDSRRAIIPTSEID